jgi:hypothetical protein
MSNESPNASDAAEYEAPSFEELPVTGGLAETAPAVTGISTS